MTVGHRRTLTFDTWNYKATRLRLRCSVYKAQSTRLKTDTIKKNLMANKKSRTEELCNQPCVTESHLRAPLATK